MQTSEPDPAHAAAAVREALAAIPGGTMIFDATRGAVPHSVFTQSASDNAPAVPGRGTVKFLARPEGDWVLRHYCRGGFVARFLSDRYLYTGAARTRPMREWRLLAKLVQQGLPVPRPVAARYQRHGLWYRADLITERVPGAPLSQRLQDGTVTAADWRMIGTTIARFHHCGVFHADLNAHNILLDAPTVCYLLDFDRGRILPPGVWQRANLDRLLRSLRKIAASMPALQFPEARWQELLDGYSNPS